jgi:L-threonylcarbamoyladenylate synthase
MGFLIKLAGKKIDDIQIFLDEAVDYIIQGKIIGFPTDSVYGIGGNPLNLAVLERINKIKFREQNKGFLLLISDIKEAEKIVEFNDISRKLATHFWPGQLTLILKRKEPNIIPMEVSAFRNSIGLRVPKNDIILSILNKLKQKDYFGGIIGTSANYSGEPPCKDGEEIAQRFLGTGTIDFIIDNGKIKSEIPTTIVDCSTGELKFVRIGSIKEQEIRDFSQNNR